MKSAAAAEAAASKNDLKGAGFSPVPFYVKIKNDSFPESEKSR